MILSCQIEQIIGSTTIDYKMITIFIVNLFNWLHIMMFGCDSRRYIHRRSVSIEIRECRGQGVWDSWYTEVSEWEVQRV